MFSKILGFRIIACDFYVMDTEKLLLKLTHSNVVCAITQLDVILFFRKRVAICAPACNDSRIEHLDFGFEPEKCAAYYPLEA